MTDYSWIVLLCCAWLAGLLGGFGLAFLIRPRKTRLHRRVRGESRRNPQGTDDELAQLRKMAGLK